MNSNYIKQKEDLTITVNKLVRDYSDIVRDRSLSSIDRASKLEELKGQIGAVLSVINDSDVYNIIVGNLDAIDERMTAIENENKALLAENLKYRSENMLQLVLHLKKLIKMQPSTIAKEGLIDELSEGLESVASFINEADGQVSDVLKKLYFVLSEKLEEAREFSNNFDIEYFNNPYDD